MNFPEVSDMMRKLYTKKGRLPDKILVNPVWQQRQFQQQFVLRKPGENPLEQFTGIKVVTDESISTFKFVYNDEDD